MAGDRGDLTGHSLRTARARAYALLSRLVLGRLSDTTIAELGEVPALMEGLPADPVTDNLAADHHNLFAMQVFPYAGVFTSNDTLIGGPAAERCAERLSAAGLAIDTGDSPDHLGHQLALIAHCTRTDAAAVRAAIDDVVLPWLIPFAGAIANQTKSWWTGVVELIVELIADHRDELGPPSPQTLPTPKQILDEPSTGLRSIARFLTTPIQSGAFISADEVRAIARRTDIPPGFGSRQQLTGNLFHNAAEYDQLPAVLRALDDLFARRAEAYRELAGHPSLADAANAWAKQIEGTRDLIERIETGTGSSQ